MKDKNEIYVASVTIPMKYPESIVKDVTEKLNRKPDLTIKQLLDYIVKDEGDFNKEEKDVVSCIEDNIQEYEEHKDNNFSERILKIKSFNELRGYREFLDENNCYTQLIKPNHIAKKYFESKKLDGRSYKALEMEVYIGIRYH